MQALNSVATGLLIKGEWREAAPGKMFDVEDRARGKVLVSIAQAGSEGS